jgi:hypothetical protein
MQTIASLVDFVSPRPKNDAPQGVTERVWVAATAVLASAGLAGLWGLAANASGVSALSNVVKVPVLLVVSALASLPAVLLAWTLLGARGARATDLLVAYAVGLFGGTLVLGALAPIVLLYQHSSASFGPFVAQASAGAAFVTGLLVFVRALWRLVPSGQPRHLLAVPIALQLVLQLAALTQLASATSPIFAERTALGRGVDAWVAPAAPRGRITPMAASGSVAPAAPSAWVAPAAPNQERE